MKAVKIDAGEILKTKHDPQTVRDRREGRRLDWLLAEVGLANAALTAEQRQTCQRVIDDLPRVATLPKPICRSLTDATNKRDYRRVDKIRALVATLPQTPELRAVLGMFKG